MSVEALAELLENARSSVALTGAGVSTDSGIPDFRSVESGLWRDHDPAKVASIDGFRHSPRAFYDFWGERFAGLAGASPNVTHLVVAALERAQRLRGVITQNIDGLHQKGGSDNVLEVHGSFQHARCLGCGRLEGFDEVMSRVHAGRLPVCEACGELVKPDVVLFGEELPPAFSQAERWVRECDLLLVLGSSLGVYPVAGLVPLARSRGARVALVNRESSPYDDDADVVLHAELAPTMEALASTLGLELSAVPS